MNFNLAELQQMQKLLAQVQASNQVICAEYEYDNPVLETKQFIEFFCNKDNQQEILNKTSELFAIKLPDYNLNNLLTDKLLQNVLNILKKHSTDKKIKIPNGCCSLQNCPTKIYYECVLQAIIGLDK